MKHIPDWPGMMKRATAAAYCDMSVAAFEREVFDGRLPGAVIIGGLRRWSRRQIDEHIERLFGEAPFDWRKESKLYAEK